MENIKLIVVVDYLVGKKCTINQFVSKTFNIDYYFQQE